MLAKQGSISDRNSGHSLQRGSIYDLEVGSLAFTQWWNWELHHIDRIVLILKVGKFYSELCS